MFLEIQRALRAYIFFGISKVGAFQNNQMLFYVGQCISILVESIVITKSSFTTLFANISGLVFHLLQGIDNLIACVAALYLATVSMFSSDRS